MFILLHKKEIILKYRGTVNNEAQRLYNGVLERENPRSYEGV